MDEAIVVTETKNYSFQIIEELKNLLDSPLKFLIIGLMIFLIAIAFVKVWTTFAKSNYRKYLKKQIEKNLQIELKRKMLDSLFDKYYNKITEQITDYVKESSPGIYKVDTDKVKRVLKDESDKLKKELIEQSELEKLLLSRLADSFGE